MKHISYTCDGCGKKATNRIIDGWLHFEKPVSVTQNFSISEEMSDLCSVECFALAVEKKLTLDFELGRDESWIEDWRNT